MWILSRSARRTAFDPQGNHHARLAPALPSITKGPEMPLAATRRRPASTLTDTCRYAHTAEPAMFEYCFAA
jgi:hypothetical protein